LALCRSDDMADRGAERANAEVRDVLGVRGRRHVQGAAGLSAALSPAQGGPRPGGPPAGRHVRRPQAEGSMAVFGSREAAEEFIRDDPFVNRAWSRPRRCGNGTRSLARFERVPSRLRSRRPTCLNKPPSCVAPAATVRARPTKRMLNTPDRSTRCLRAATDCFMPGALRRVSLVSTAQSQIRLSPPAVLARGRLRVAFENFLRADA
jgi:hypothetical protein